MSTFVVVHKNLNVFELADDSYAYETLVEAKQRLISMDDAEHRVIVPVQISYDLKMYYDNARYFSDIEKGFQAHLDKYGLEANEVVIQF